MRNVVHLILILLKFINCKIIKYIKSSRNVSRRVVVVLRQTQFQTEPKGETSKTIYLMGKKETLH